MTRFSDEVRIIPTVAWCLAVLVAVATFCLLLFVAIPHDNNVKDWPGVGQIALSLLGALVPAAYILLIGYIYADARRRGMRYVMWTLLAIFVPNTIGIILYFILRDPLLAQCPKCGAPGRAGFAFCPQCGNQLSTACPACKRQTDSGWQRCAYCGAVLGAAVPPPAPRPTGN
jgi:hypothetical protein